jgi:hypothetical protein
MRSEKNNKGRQSLPIQFEYNGEVFKGEARPLSASCCEGVCFELEVSLNEQELGIIHCTRGGWKMDHQADQNFVNTIGERIQLWYE